MVIGEVKDMKKKFELLPILMFILFGLLLGVFSALWHKFGIWIGVLK